MLILVTCLLLFLSAFTLTILRGVQPNARYGWLVATGGAALAFLSVLAWPVQMPFALTLPAWQPQTIFSTPILFQADGVSWALALSISALTLAVMMTAAARPVFINSLSWSGILTLGGMGILAVTAENPLTLLLIWSLLDLLELLAQLSSVNGKNSERVVTSFAVHLLGIALLLWAYLEGFSNGSGFNFQTAPQSAITYIVIATGLRLGVLPLHLPYAPDSALRRGFGTSLRLVGAASSLGVLGHVAFANNSLTFILTLLTSGAALYGGWMWLRAPDVLNARPYWVIGMAALAMLSALSKNTTGAAAWAATLVLAGGTLFLSSIQDQRLNRTLLLGTWSLSALPLSLTGSAWLGSLGWAIPCAIAAQALMMAGFIRHALRVSTTDTLEEQPGWAKIVYPAGIFLLLGTQVLLGFLGWEGALQIGSWLSALLASFLTAGLVWAFRRFHIFSPIRTQGNNPAASGVNNIYQGLWSLYRLLGRLSHMVTNILEGEGGIMWTLLFLILFVSLIMQGFQ